MSAKSVGSEINNVTSPAEVLKNSMCGLRKSHVLNRWKNNFSFAERQIENKQTLNYTIFVVNRFLIFSKSLFKDTMRHFNDSLAFVTHACAAGNPDTNVPIWKAEIQEKKIRHVNVKKK